MSNRTRERGNASIAVIGLTGIVMIVLIALGDISIFFMARSKAQIAADAAALAAAAELLPGSKSTADLQAARFADANGAELVSCDCRPGQDRVQVKVAVEPSFIFAKALGSSKVFASASAEVSRRGLFRED